MSFPRPNALPRDYIDRFTDQLIDPLTGDFLGLLLDSNIDYVNPYDEAEPEPDFVTLDSAGYPDIPFNPR